MADQVHPVPGGSSRRKLHPEACGSARPKYTTINTRKSATSPVDSTQKTTKRKNTNTTKPSSKKLKRTNSRISQELCTDAIDTSGKRHNLAASSHIERLNNRREHNRTEARRRHVTCSISQISIPVDKVIDLRKQTVNEQPADKLVYHRRAPTRSVSSACSADIAGTSDVSDPPTESRRLSLRSNKSAILLPGIPYYPVTGASKGQKRLLPDIPLDSDTTKTQGQQLISVKASVRSETTTKKTQTRRLLPEIPIVSSINKAKGRKRILPEVTVSSETNGQTSALSGISSNTDTRAPKRLYTCDSITAKQSLHTSKRLKVTKKTGVTRGRNQTNSTPVRSSSTVTSADCYTSSFSAHSVSELSSSYQTTDQPSDLPEPHSLRRSSRSKTTGSCASSNSGRRPSSALGKAPSTQLNSSSSIATTTNTRASPATKSRSHTTNAAAVAMSHQDPGGGATGEGQTGDEGTFSLGAVGNLVPAPLPASESSETDDSDMGRLQALLEARGLPTHLFGVLGPRMHQLLHRSMSGGTMGKAQQLLQGIQATHDEGQQLTAIIEMCQLLVMGNEDTLAGFPVKLVVPALIALLKMEQHFDIMNHACRALTYMMEALPRSSSVVVDAIPAFLEKLQVIQCMDVAEQSLTALEMLSRRHSKAILQAGGIASCLMYLDFFSITAQRNALAVTANCAQSMTPDDFRFIRDSLPLLSTRLTHQDKKSVESCCLCFCNLVDNFQHDQRLLKEMSIHGLLTNVQQLLVACPPIISTSMFVMVIRMLAVMSSSCPDLAVVLLKDKIAETLTFLLTGSVSLNGESIELVSRTPQELFEIVSLIGELMPPLPTDGIFAIHRTMRKGPVGAVPEPVSWQWRDDKVEWHTYTPIDSKIIEAAYQAGEDEVNLSAMGRAYLVNFNSMQQTNEDTGTTRPIQRKINTASTSSLASSTWSMTSESIGERCDSREEILKEDTLLASSFIHTLFSVLYEVYSSSAGPTVRHKCLQSLLRMVYYASADLLEGVLKNQPISSHIAAMLASNDAKVIVGAIQMANTLMQKLAHIFSIYFRREGVMHQIQRLSELDPKSVSPKKCGTNSNSTESITSAVSDDSDYRSVVKQEPQNPPGAWSQSALDEATPTSSAAMRLSDVLKRKKPLKRPQTRRGSKGDEFTGESGSPRGTFGGRPSPLTRAGKDSKSGPKSFLPSFNPRSWGRLPFSTERPPVKGLTCDVCIQETTLAPVQLHSCTNTNKEKVKTWIKQQATAFLEMYFVKDRDGDEHPALDVFNKLTATSHALSADCPDNMDMLRSIADILHSSDVSPFEIIHSGLVSKLSAFLTSPNGDRDARIQQFLSVFLHTPHATINLRKKCDAVSKSSTLPIRQLITKMLACLHQLEQFPVKVHDIPTGGTTSHRGTNAMKFFTTHQLKCNLQRHPSCTSLRQWKGGPVKIDPLALVQAIERYLVMRGYGRSKLEVDDDDISDEENTDDETDDTMTAVFISQGSVRHRLEFVMGEHVLPYHMTVYQAVRQYSNLAERDENESTDTESEQPFSQANIWVQTHTIWYRPATDLNEAISLTSPKKTRAESKSSKTSAKQRKSDLWTDGQCPEVVPLLVSFLVDTLPPTIKLTDPSVDIIILLRILHAINRYWSPLTEDRLELTMRLQCTDFVSMKLCAKANRQLQDPLIIMTGNLPPWLWQIATAVPFLLPFDTRQLLFYATSFDRDRAMMRLQDNSVDTASTDSERVTPRLDRRRRMVSREDLLKQAEKVMDEITNSKSLLEIQYENEVGTGLGPTLEFYALVSNELQRTDLEIWRNGDTHSADDPVHYVHSNAGLFPAPLPRNAKSSLVNKVKAKFKFLGKFMAKSLMDSRMIDLPLSLIFYKWMLGEENSLDATDLYLIDPVLAKSFSQLEEIVRQKSRILADTSHTIESRLLALESLTMDGTSIDDLDLDFTLPGYNHIELKKGGKDLCVTLENLNEYLHLVSHWTLVEGVHRQMDSFREGFETIFPLSCLQCFYPEELDQLLCGGCDEPWDMKTLTECCRPDHGYTHASRAVHLLFTILSSYNHTQKRNFIQFVTGSPRLPVGGFRSLNPPLTIVKKMSESCENPDDYLPSVMTCVNYLKLPDYSTEAVMRQKIELASKEGQLSFYLS